jgi:aryl-alcohol dehydrogenase-like predicted oxidoreductase
MLSGGLGMASLLTGRATADGTTRYAERLASRVHPEHFRRSWLSVSSLGIGTYLGRDDDATDQAYRQSVECALDLGLNVVDAAINYRHQRSERAVGAALGAAIAGGAVARDEVVVATKGGFVAFDALAATDLRTYFTRTYLEPGIIGPDDMVGGVHCMTPRYLADQIERSRANLGLETIDIYYVHNPETQLSEVDQAEFQRRIGAAFAALEGAVADAKIGCYGVATWSGFRNDPGKPDYLSLETLVTAARTVGGRDHHFRVIQLPYNLGMPEAFTHANQRVGNDTVSTVEAAERLGVYVMASASVHQGELTRNLPAVVAEYLPGLETDAQRALQFVRSTPGIGTALVGMKSAAHVRENGAVAVTAPLAWEQFRHLFSGA